jgi:uncharacterized membrane protein
MPEIIPNLHPFVVHFPIALIIVSAFAMLGAKFAGDRPIASELEILGRWTLWAGALAALVAAAAGWQAFNSVDHDGPGHTAMIVHRSWALITTGFIVILALWSVWQRRSSKKASWIYTIALLMSVGLVAATGWLGGELVYRHGLGVIKTRIQIVPDPAANNKAHTPVVEHHQGASSSSRASGSGAKGGHDHHSHSH